MNAECKETMRNLYGAFAAKTQTLALFEFAAKTARKKELLPAAELLAMIAAHERSHAKNFYRAIAGPVVVEVEMPELPLKDTRAFLVAAEALKRHRGQTQYPRYETVARSEAFDEVVVLFRAIGRVESDHARLLAACIARIDEGTLYSRPEPVLWVCDKCGYPHEGKTPPARCPGCGHPRQWFRSVGTQ